MSCALSSSRSCSAPANGSSTRPPPGYPSAWSTPGPSATASSSSPTNQPELRNARPPASVLLPARRTEASLPTKRRVSSLPDTGRSRGEHRAPIGSNALMTSTGDVLDEGRRAFERRHWGDAYAGLAVADARADLQAAEPGL